VADQKIINLAELILTGNYIRVIYKFNIIFIKKGIKFNFNGKYLFPFLIKNYFVVISNYMKDDIVKGWIVLMSMKIKMRRAGML